MTSHSLPSMANSSIAWWKTSFSLTIS